MTLLRAPLLPRRLATWLTARRERGSATIQMVALMPALFTLMFLGVQAAVLYQGRTITLAAAQEGARVSASADGTNAAGVAAASDFVSSTSAGLKNTSVSGNRTATTATITVTTHTVSLIPFVSPTITQSASMPVERLTG